MTRFIAPYAFLVGLNRFAGSPIGRSNRLAAIHSIAALAFGLAALALSPEAGLVTIGSQVVYFAYKALKDVRSVFPLVGTLASLAVCLLLFGTDYLMAVFAFGAGGGNFPVVPSAFILFYLGCLFWCVPVLVRYAWHYKQDQNRYLLMALACASVAFLPAALGRCDPGHVIWNGAGAIVLASILIWCCYPRKFWLYLIVPMFVCGWLGTVATTRFQTVLVEFLMAGLRGGTKPLELKDSPLVSELHLEKYASVGVPFEADPSIEQYLRRTGKYLPGYYWGTCNIPAGKGIERKFRCLQQAAVLLVPGNVTEFQNADQVDRYLASDAYRLGQEQSQSAFLTGLQFYPVAYHIVNARYHSEFEIMKYLARNYDIIQSAGGYALMAPKPGTQLPRP